MFYIIESLFSTGLQIIGAIRSVLVIILNNVHIFAMNSSLFSPVQQTLGQYVIGCKAPGDKALKMNTSAVLALQELTVY